jgi:hypothetical protein
MGNCSGGRLGENTNPNRDGTEDRFLSFDHFFILTLFFVLGCFIDLNILEMDDVYHRKANLEIPVSKLYDMMDIN